MSTSTAFIADPPVAGDVAQGTRYNPATVRRTEHRIEEKDVAVGNIRRELRRRRVRACRLNGITNPL